MEILLKTAAVVGALSVICGAVVWWVRSIVKTWRLLRDFLEDWAGEPSRPGVVGRPGVMTRLSSIEKQLHPNSGKSLRDAVDQTHTLAAETQQLIADHIDDLTAHQPREEE